MELSRGVFGVRGANVNIRCRGGMEECEEGCKSVSMKWHDPRGNGFCVCVRLRKIRYLVHSRGNGVDVPDISKVCVNKSMFVSRSCFLGTVIIGRHSDEPE